MTVEFNYVRRYLQVTSGYSRTTNGTVWEEVDVTSSVNGVCISLSWCDSTWVIKEKMINLSHLPQVLLHRSVPGTENCARKWEVHFILPRMSRFSRCSLYLKISPLISSMYTSHHSYQAGGREKRKEGGKKIEGKMYWNVLKCNSRNFLEELEEPRFEWQAFQLISPHFILKYDTTQTG